MCVRQVLEIENLQPYFPYFFSFLLSLEAIVVETCMPIEVYRLSTHYSMTFFSFYFLLCLVPCLKAERINENEKEMSHCY